MIALPNRAVALKYTEAKNLVSWLQKYYMQSTNASELRKMDKFIKELYNIIHNENQIPTETKGRNNAKGSP